MDKATELLAQLSGLLAENGIGLERLTPRPRGGRLSGESQQAVERVLDTVESSQASKTNLVYGNGCFAVGRYVEAAAVYERIAVGQTNCLEAGFNLGLAYLRLRKAKEATAEFTQVIDKDPSLAEAYYQRGNAHDDLGEPDLALTDYGHAIVAKQDYLQAYYNRGVALSHRVQRLLEPGRVAG